MVRDLYERYGRVYSVEYDWALTPEKKEEIRQRVLEDRKLPDFEEKPEKISYLDGCKVYFGDSWVILRFSGTEPRIRIFAEAPEREKAERLAEKMAAFAGVLGAEG